MWKDKFLRGKKIKRPNLIKTKKNKNEIIIKGFDNILSNLEKHKIRQNAKRRISKGKEKSETLKLIK